MRLVQLVLLGAAAAALALAACAGTAPGGPGAPPESRAAVDSAARTAADEPRRRRARGTQAPAVDEAAPVPEGAARSYERALAAMAREDWLEAELELEQLVLEHDELAGPHVNLAIVYMHDGRDDDARAALERALAIEPAHAAAANQLGILSRRQGKFAEAEDAYRRAIDADPAYALAHYNLGVLLDLYLHRPAEALEQYEHYQDLLAEPDQQVGRWIIDLRRRLGVTDDASRVAREDGA